MLLNLMIANREFPLFNKLKDVVIETDLHTLQCANYTAAQWFAL